VGSNPDDQIGSNGVTQLSNANYVIKSSFWNDNRGAITWGNGSTGVSGIVSDANSLVGSNPYDSVGGFGVTSLNDGNYVVQSPFWNGHRGAVTWGSGMTGQTLDGSGLITMQNSLVGRSPKSDFLYVVLDSIHQSFLVSFVTDGSGRVAVGLD